jgi:hypothetical protein
MHIYDQGEAELPDAGLIRLRHAETDDVFEVDSSDAEVRKAYRSMWLKREKELKDVFARSGVDYTRIRTDESYVKPLMQLFKKRERRA